MVYLVVRHGVHLQGIVGIFDSLELAEAAVVLSKGEEPDDYHNFMIEPMEINRRLKLEVW